MGWLSGWDYRKEVPVTNANADYQTKVLIGKTSDAVGADVDCGGHIADDFDDLRFTAADGTTLLDYWIESIVDSGGTKLATVWVQNNATPDATLYMYYGGTETAVSNGPNTFIQYHGAATSGYLDSLDLSGGSNFRYRTKIKAGLSGNQNILFGLANHANLADDWAGLQTYNNPDLRYVKCGNEASYSEDSEAPWWGYDTYHIGEALFLAGASLHAFCDSNEIASGLTTNLPNEDMGLVLWIAAGAVVQDWSLIAKYAATEPSFAFGSEEMAGAVKTGSATLAGTGALAAAAHRIRSAAATTSGTGSLSATAQVTRLASATLSGIGSLAATGGVYKLASATMAGVGTLTATALVTRAATATLSGAGTLTAKGGAIRISSATMSGQGSLAAAGTVIEGAIYGSATLSGTGSLSAKAVYIVIAKATLSGTGTLIASAIVYSGLSPTLLAAQTKPYRLPYVEAKVYDYEQGIKRLSWTRLYEGSEPDNHHGIAFDGQGSMHRIRAAASNLLYYQKVTTPGPSSDYSQWTQIATDCDGPCAIAASGAKVYIFYRKADNTLRKYYSHNYGADWTNAELAAYADVLSLAACWWATGNTVVCFALKASQVNGITLDTSDQTTTPHTWSDGNHPLLATYGIGATFNASTPAIEIVLAGKESDSPYNHYDLFRTKLSNTYNFSALESFLMAPDGEDTTYQYPDCHLPAAAQAYETNRIVAVEKYAGTTAYTRPLTCNMVKGTSWSDTTFTEPKPFLDLSPSYGLRIASTSAHWWMSKPDGVWQAPRPAASPLDLTADIMTLLLQNVIASPTSVGRGNLVLELDNSKGIYNVGAGLVPAKLNKRYELVLRLGYKTTAGDESVDAGTFWLDRWEYVVLPHRSLFLIYALDGSGLINLWTARYQMRWNKPGDTPRSVWQILYQVLARVGIKLTNTPPKPQSSAINNFYPDFTLSPGSKGDAAITRLLSFVPDNLVFRGQEAFTKNPLDEEESCYSYGTDHVITTAKYSDAVTLSRSRSLGQAGDDSRIVRDAFDWTLLELAIDILDQDYDPNLTTTTRAQERADAILRRNALEAKGGQITVPTNVAQELLDVVDLTDVRCGISRENYRVQAIQTDYDRRKGRYEQRLTIGAP